MPVKNKLFYWHHWWKRKIVEILSFREFRVHNAKPKRLISYVLGSLLPETPEAISVFLMPSYNLLSFLFILILIYIWIQNLISKEKIKHEDRTQGTEVDNAMRRITGKWERRKIKKMGNGVVWVGRRWEKWAVMIARCLSPTNGEQMLDPQASTNMEPLKLVQKQRHQNSLLLSICYFHIHVHAYGHQRMDIHEKYLKGTSF